MKALLGPLLILINKVWDAVTFGKKARTREKTSEATLDGRGRDASNRFNKWLQKPKDKR